MKKVFLFIMLLCCSIVFTGCGNSNSYDGQAVETINIIVNKNMMDIAVASASTSYRYSEAEGDISLLFNNVIFDSYRIDGEGNYIFSKVMYDSIAYQMVSGNTTPNIIIKFGNREVNIECSSMNVPKNLQIYVLNGKVHVSDEGNNIEVISVNGEDYVDRNKITKVKIEKYSDTEAKVTFYNVLGEGKEIVKDKELSSVLLTWKISALDSKRDPLKSWEKSDNDRSANLQIIPYGTDGNKYYIISMTSLGNEAAHGHNLSDTMVKIDYIRYDGWDLVDTGLLSSEDSIYKPY